jgi:parvulin-like peptidyl-prolyl isomerase
MLALAPLLLLVIQGGPETAPASRPANPTQKRDPGIATRGDRVVAIINDDVITQSELDVQLGTNIAFGGITNTAEILKERKNELYNMIKQHLLTVAARSRKIDEKQIDAEVQDAIREEERVRGGPSGLRRWVQAQGKTLDEWQREKRAGILAQRLQAAEVGYEVRPERDVSVTPSDLRNYYRANVDKFQTGPMVKAQQILLTDAQLGSHEKVVARTKQVVEDIAGGKDFSDLARQFSAWRPENGGNLGWVERGKGLDKRVEDFLFNCAPGAVSPPIELDGETAIVKLLDKRAAGVLPFEDPDTQQRVSVRLQDEKVNAMLRQLSERLWRDSYVWVTAEFKN